MADFLIDFHIVACDISTGSRFSKREKCGWRCNSAALEQRVCANGLVLVACLITTFASRKNHVDGERSLLCAAQVSGARLQQPVSTQTFRRQLPVILIMAVSPPTHPPRVRPAITCCATGAEVAVVCLHSVRACLAAATSLFPWQHTYAPATKNPRARARSTNRSTSPPEPHSNIT